MFNWRKKQKCVALLWVLLNQLLKFPLLLSYKTFICTSVSCHHLWFLQQLFFEMSDHSSLTQFGDAIYRMTYVSLFSLNNLSLVISRVVIALYKIQAHKVWWRISHKATGKTFLKCYIHPWGALVIKVCRLEGIQRKSNRRRNENEESKNLCSGRLWSIHSLF